MRLGFRSCTFVMILIWNVSCNKADEQERNPSLLGTWKLVAVLADPGDGSGKFQSVSSNRTLTFYPDGSLHSSQKICNFNDSPDQNGSGVYSLTDSTIISSDCPNDFSKIRFSIREGSLLLYYPCIESCVEKYVRINK